MATFQYRATPNTLAEGDLQGGLLDTKGNLKVALINLNGTGSPSATPSDAFSNAQGAIITDSFGLLYNGSTWDRARTPIVFKNLSAVVVTSETTVWTPAAGKKFRLMGFILAQGVATGAVTLKDNTAGTTIFTIPANTVGVAFISPSMGNGILSAAANNVLTATGASTETLTGVIFGTEE